MARLDRLLRPHSIAVIGGGAWCANVIRECQKVGFGGELWPVHPAKAEIGGVTAFASVEALPEAPDAVFIGVNRQASVELTRALSAMGAGGAVCFASGFSEAVAELADGADLQAELLQAAGEMPFLGPNCYGFLNALDGALLWPDQHGLVPVERGVALVTQSSNIAINLTMQARGLPIAYAVTAGNQAQIDLAEIGIGLLDDPRVTALGLHIEGVSDLRGMEALAAKARELGKPIVAVKVGASEQAQAATVSHTASVAGSDAGARALLKRLGIAQARTLPEFLEALKLLHIAGPLPSNRIASMSCSGGEASLMADLSLGHDVTYPPLSKAQRGALAEALGPKVALANPLDYHTYIWGDQAALTRCFSAMMAGSDLAMGCVVLDFPRADRCDASEWDMVIEAIAETSQTTGKAMALVASLPETMPEHIAVHAASLGITAFGGMAEALAAIELAAWLGASRRVLAPVLLPGAPGEAETLLEAEAKAALRSHGVRVPGAQRAGTGEEAAIAAEALTLPVVLKGEGIAHKTEAGAVVLGLETPQSVAEAAALMQAESFLVEEMITGAVAELLIGVVRDPAHGFVLTLGAGGVLTEIMHDSVSLILPASDEDILNALENLRIAPLLAGYRGAPAADKTAIVSTVRALQSYVTEQAQNLHEAEINPLLCGPDFAIAADALITLGKDAS